MERTISKTLEDIRNAIMEVDSFFETRPKRYEVTCQTYVCGVR